jgi:hypothetical protein
MNAQGLAGERMVSVDGELAVVDSSDVELARLARLVLHLDLGPDEPEFGRHILQGRR